MHAARALSLKRKNSLQRRSGLQRGLTNGDLSTAVEEPVNSPPSWCSVKWDERKNAFVSAFNSGGISRMFSIVALLGVMLMVGSLFFGRATGLLEIGVSILLFSLFCLIFVRCDADEGKGKLEGEDNQLSDIVIEALPDGKGEHHAESDLNEAGDQIKALLMRSSPRKIPSPLRVFGYEMNFSPIQECSEPSSNASSFLTRNSSFPSRLAHSGTGDSLSRVSSKASCGGGGVPGGSPINEELEDFDYDQPLQLKLDANIRNHGSSEKCLEGGGHSDPEDAKDLVSLSTSNLSLDSNTASFDTDDSITADLSVITVIERKDCTNGQNQSNSGINSPK